MSPIRKRRRSNDESNEKTVEEPTKKTLKKATSSENVLETTAEKHIRVIIEDDDIEILEFGTYFDEPTFLFRRSNGARALLPTKVANIRYPDAVMEFYEKHFVGKL